MGTLADWHGTRTEFKRLLEVMEHNCTCDRENPTAPACPAHQMVTEQRVLDGLRFVRRKRVVFLEREFDPRSEWGI